MYLIGYSDLSPLLVLVALAIMIAVLLMRSQRHFARRRGDASPIVRTPRPEPDDGAPLAHSPTQTARWEVHMHDVARDLSGRLDSKMGALEQLILEADRAATRLEAALAAAMDDSAAPMHGPQVQTLAAEGPDPQPRNEEIYTLADYGFAAAAIAQRTGVPVGEIELVLGLRDKR